MSRSADHGGYTLVEMLVAVSILAIVLTASATVFRNVIRATSTCSETMDRQLARMRMDRLFTDDFTNIVLYSPNSFHGGGDTMMFTILDDVVVDSGNTCPHHAFIHYVVQDDSLRHLMRIAGIPATGLVDTTVVVSRVAEINYEYAHRTDAGGTEWDHAWYPDTARVCPVAVRARVISSINNNGTGQAVDTFFRTYYLPMGEYDTTADTDE